MLKNHPKGLIPAALANRGCSAFCRPGDLGERPERLATAVWSGVLHDGGLRLLPRRLRHRGPVARRFRENPPE